MGLRNKILIVEDEPFVRDVCQQILRRESFEIVVAENGAQGLAIYLRMHQEICLVLSDVSMPEMDGIEMAKKMLEALAHTNIILMSGHHLDRVVPDDLRRLCSVIQKPFTAGRLVEAVRKCLRYEEDRRRERA